jgi:hypothetical protein
MLNDAENPLISPSKQVLTIADIHREDDRRKQDRKIMAISQKLHQMDQTTINEKVRSHQKAQ